MIAFVGLRDQLVDFALGDLRQDAIAFADGNKNRIEHGVDAANDLGVGALELFRLAALGEPTFLRCLDQSHQFLLQALRNQGHIVDGKLHFFVVALVGMGDRLVDLAARNLRENPIPLADGQQNRVQHVVDAAHDLGVRALELFRLAAVARAALPARPRSAAPFPSAGSGGHWPRC